jgi:hypothetical protein
LIRCTQCRCSSKSKMKMTSGLRSKSRDFTVGKKRGYHLKGLRCFFKFTAAQCLHTLLPSIQKRRSLKDFFPCSMCWSQSSISKKNQKCQKTFLRQIPIKASKVKLKLYFSPLLRARQSACVPKSSKSSSESTRSKC